LRHFIHDHQDDDKPHAIGLAHTRSSFSPSFIHTIRVIVFVSESYVMSAWILQSAVRTAKPDGSTSADKRPGGVRIALRHFIHDHQDDDKPHAIGLAHTRSSFSPSFIHTIRVIVFVSESYVMSAWILQSAVRTAKPDGSTSTDKRPGTSNARSITSRVLLPA